MNNWKEFMNVVNKNTRFAHLNKMIISQAALETGYGETKLCQDYNNYFGMKFRPEMEGKAYAVTYKTKSEPTGSAVFCGFKSIEEGILGYFTFLERAPYRGIDKAKLTPEEYIKALAPIWCPANPDYANHVLKIHEKLFGDAFEPSKVPSPFFVYKDNDVTFHTSKESALNAVSSAIEQGYNAITLTKKMQGKNDSKKVKILLNPGHAGTSGASGKNPAIKEEVFTELQAVTIKSILDKEAAIVCDIIRQNEVGGLQAVGKYAQGYDIAIALHFNASSNKEYYTCAMTGGNPKPGSLKLATQIVKAICAGMGYKVFDGDGIMKDHIVTVTKEFDKTNCPAAFLLESEFIDDETDLEAFKKKVLKEAEIIAFELIKYVASI